MATFNIERVWREPDAEGKPGRIAEITEEGEGVVATAWCGYSGDLYIDTEHAWFTADELRNLADLLETL